jgi:hypothetical protein
MVMNTKSVNITLGVRLIGPTIAVRACNSTTIRNVTGVSFSGGGAL